MIWCASYFNQLFVERFLGSIKIIIYLFRHWDDEMKRVVLSPTSRFPRTCLSNQADNMTADDLPLYVTRLSVAMVLTKLLWHISAYVFQL